MKMVWRIFLIVLSLPGGSIWGQTNQEPVVPNVTICDLAIEPAKYVGKMIKVRANVFGYPESYLEDFSFDKQGCRTYIRVLLVLRPDMQPVPDFTLVRDESFKRFQQEVQRMRVEATFEGRFDSILGLQDGKRTVVGRGYGKDGLAQGRLVLRKVSDVVSRPIPRK